MCGTLYVTVHEAEHLPGDPTLVSVSILGAASNCNLQIYVSVCDCVNRSRARLLHDARCIGTCLWFWSICQSAATPDLQALSRFCNACMLGCQSMNDRQ